MPVINIVARASKPTNDANLPDHLRVFRNDRGIDYMPPIPSDSYPVQVRVSESSANSRPCIWLRVTLTADAAQSGWELHPDVHLAAEDAWRLAEQLQHLVRNHYLGDARPAWAADHPYRAADLPAHSIVAAWADFHPHSYEAAYKTDGPHQVVFHRKARDGQFADTHAWRTTDLHDSRVVTDAEVQRALDGGGRVVQLGAGSRTREPQTVAPGEGQPPKPGMLLIFRGLPGAGKTTLAREWVAGYRPQRARVNRDDLRGMCHHGVYLPVGEHHPGTEHIIVTAQLAAISALLRAGVDVVCDDTNLDPPTVTRLEACAAEAGTTVAVQDLTDVPVEECIRRDAARDKPVGEDVIRGMQQRHLLEAE